MATYCCSDIHGQYGLYKKMINGLSLKNDDVLYILGDIVDRGPGGIKIILDVIKRINSGENIVCLMGNHELMMLNYLKNENRWDRRSDIWLHPANGGDATLSQFEELSEKDKKGVVSFLEGLWLQKEITVEDKVFLLSHSAFLKNKGDIRHGDVGPRVEEYIVWNSPWRDFEYIDKLEYKEDERVHIIGHVPIQRIFAFEALYSGVRDFEDAMKDIKFPYVDQENNIVVIDGGCGHYLKEGMDDKAGLVRLNLNEFACGESGVLLVR